MREDYQSDFLEAEAIKNGVGGRVVELVHLGACVSIKGISPNSSKTIGEEKRAMITVYITFWSVNSIWASNEYKMCSFSPVIFKSVQSKKNIIILCDAPSAASEFGRRTLRLSLALSSLVGEIGRAGLTKEVELLRPGPRGPKVLRHHILRWNAGGTNYSGWWHRQVGRQQFSWVFKLDKYAIFSFVMTSGLKVILISLTSP